MPVETPRQRPQIARQLVSFAVAFVLTQTLAVHILPRSAPAVVPLVGFIVLYAGFFALTYWAYGQILDRFRP